jgi:hypothetical protein
VVLATAEQDRVSAAAAIQTKLAAAVVNAELALVMLEDGPARERVHRALEAVWAASALLEIELPA